MGNSLGIVTGASSGIGRAVANRLASDGFTVLLVGRDQARLEATAGDIAESGGQAHIAAIDITADDGPRRIIQAAVDAADGDQIALIVHCAGVSLFSPFESADLAELDEHYRVNLRAPYALTQAALPHLATDASIILFSSNLAHVGMAGGVGYAASKAAVEGMLKSLVVELAPRGIRVNAIAPGIINTPMTAHIFDNPTISGGAISATPSGRLGEVADVAGIVSFLASRDAAHMHGVSILVDGGWNAQ